MLQLHIDDVFTLRRWLRITFCLWRRTYSGHLTKRVRSRLGARSPPVRSAGSTALSGARVAAVEQRGKVGM
jgi:hypothetical protein